jgi:tripartite ATP-independent transporter DctM subunit
MMIEGVESFPLLAIPFFVLAANLMNAGGLTDRIFNLAQAIFSPLRGGLAQVNVGGSVIFAGMSGAALADLGGLGAIEIKAMRERNYPAGLSAGITLAACVIGPLIPPSIVMIIYGAATDTSVGRLFLAGVLPGLCIASLLMIYIYLWATLLKVDWGKPEPFDFRRLLLALRQGGIAMMLPVVVIAALVLGFSTPTEVGALAAAYALLAGLVHRSLTWKGLWHCMTESVITTAVIMMVIAVSVAMGWITTIERIPHEAAQFMSHYVSNPIIGIIVINVFLLVIGMFLETAPAILILAPILLPYAMELGIDPIHFGVILTFNLTLGIITPPVGIGLFVTARVARVTPELVLRGVLPFMVPLLLGLLIISFQPWMSLWLPNLVFGPTSP